MNKMPEWKVRYGRYLIRGMRKKSFLLKIDDFWSCKVMCLLYWLWLGCGRTKQTPEDAA